MHGGAAPQVLAAAEDRLRALEHPALSCLGWLIAQKDFPSAAYAASRDVLDRLRGKPHESVAMNVTGDLTIDVRIREARKRLAERNPE